MQVLAPIWAEKPETASRVRGRIEALLDAATVRGFRHGQTRHSGKATSRIFSRPESRVLFPLPVHSPLGRTGTRRAQGQRRTQNGRG